MRYADAKHWKEDASFAVDQLYALCERVIGRIEPASKVLDVGGWNSRFATLAMTCDLHVFVVDLSAWDGKPFGPFDVAVCIDRLGDEPEQMIRFIGAHGVSKAFFAVSDGYTPEAFGALMVCYWRDSRVALVGKYLLAEVEGWIGNVG